MSLDELLQNPFVLLGLGWFAKQLSEGQVGAAGFGARLHHVENWISRNNDLRELMVGMGRDLKTLFNRVEDIDEAIDRVYHPPAAGRRPRARARAH